MKKSIIFAVIFALFITVFCTTGVGASAESESDRIANASKWDGTVYTVGAESEIYTFAGDGTKKAPYQINSADDLAKLAANVRFANSKTNYAGKYFVLNCDVDLQNKGWWGIGGCMTDTKALWNDDKMFEGNFDGRGHVIYNFSLANKDSDGNSIFVNGLFGYVGDCSISNLGIASGTVELSDTNRTAALIGASRYSLDLYNCFNRADFIYTIGDAYAVNEFRVGGLMGAVMNNNAAVRNIVDCYNSGNVTATINKAECGAVLGGIAGYLSDGTNNFERCYNTGTFNLTSSCSKESPNYDTAIGSLVGSLAWGAKYNFRDCAGGGSITYTHSMEASTFLPYVGTFVGYMNGNSTTVLEGTNTSKVALSPATVADVPINVPDLGDRETDDAIRKAFEAFTSSVADVVIPIADDELYYMVAVADNEETDSDKQTPPEETDKKAEDTAVPVDGNSSETYSDATDGQTEEKVQEKKGCKSSVVCGMLSTTAVLAGVTLLLKKRREDR